MASFTNHRPPNADDLAAIKELFSLASTTDDPSVLLEILDDRLFRWEARWSFIRNDKPVGTYGPHNPRKNLIEGVVEQCFLNPSFPFSYFRDTSPGALSQTLLRAFWPYLVDNPSILFGYASSDPDLAYLCTRVFGHFDGEPIHSVMDTVTLLDRVIHSIWAPATQQLKVYDAAIRSINAKQLPHLRFAIPEAPRSAKGEIVVSRWKPVLESTENGLPYHSANHPTRHALRLLLATMSKSVQSKQEQVNRARSLATSMVYPGPNVSDLDEMLVYIPAYLAFTTEIARAFGKTVPRHLLSSVFPHEES